MFTIEKALDNRHNNFTLLRLLAAVAVLYYHSYPIAEGRFSHDPVTSWLLVYWGMGLGGLAVGMFFVVSGFLVTASFVNRGDLFAFIESRALRIFPGLLVALFFCAFIVGPLFSDLIIVDYLSHELSWRYVYHNIALLFGIQYQLPGVFVSNPLHGVNGSLWTLPVELTMYLWVVLLGALGLLGHRVVFNLFVLMIAILGFQGGLDASLFDGSVLNPIFFLIGMFFYINRDAIILSFPILLLWVTVLFLFRDAQYYYLLQAIFLSYLILFVALAPICRLPTLDKWGDYSYGVYIYSFPVQQSCVALCLILSP